MNTPSILTVGQLNTYIKSVIDSDMNLNTVFVVGEISNFTDHYRTGHFYLSLKDETSSIKAVMFRSANERLKFKPENGMSVITRGRVSVFERDGQYQLYIDDMQPDGLGALNLAFEQLKNKLAAEGLFDQNRKKSIPKYPARIGVITSPTGAAVRDIFNVLSRRFPLAQVVMCPVQVQGSSAAPQIIDAEWWRQAKSPLSLRSGMKRILQSAILLLTFGHLPLRQRRNWLCRTVLNSGHIFQASNTAAVKQFKAKFSFSAQNSAVLHRHRVLQARL